MPGFDALNADFKISLTINQLATKTYSAYIRQVAAFCLHFKCLPDYCSQKQINSYLALLATKSQGPSATTLKQTVYALKYYFKNICKVEHPPVFPNIIQRKSLPVVLSQRECKILFRTPSNLKHRVILSLIYSAGLRISEATSLLISDIDFDRKTIMVRNGKGNKDRCLPLAEVMIVGLNKYLSAYRPKSFLFYSFQTSVRYSIRSVQKIMSDALQKAQINKPGASVHSLRHSFATHLLENGTNIVQIQGLMGHNDITTTLIYTKLVHQNLHAVKSPLDTLYGL